MAYVFFGPERFPRRGARPSAEQCGARPAPPSKLGFVDAVALSAVPLTELVAAARSGSSPAEGEICARFAPAVRAFARRRLVSRDAVDEFTQEVFLTFLPALRRGAIEDPARAGGFLLGICRNLAREGARQNERRQALWAEHSYALEALPAEVSSPTPFTLQLEDCMSRMSARTRQVIQLGFLEDLDHEEVAQRLEITRENARVLRHRSLEALRNCMDDSLSWEAA